ncbi:MAG: hypothetical protein IJS48_05210 [Prevotella sp.]|nr:hypothetical protein [Prevotella sp.]
MKLFISIVCTLLFIPCCIFAQWTYHPFAKEGKVFIGENKKYEMLGDTVICNKGYKRVFITQKSEETCYWGATRDEGMQVYIVKAGNNTEMLFYDFGDDNNYVLDYGREEAHVREAFVWVTNSGDYRKLRYAVPYDKNSDLQRASAFLWIDGIGNMSDPFDPIYGDGYFDCYEDGVCVYNFALLEEMILNQSTSIKASSFSHSISNTLFDLQGRRITSIPSRGVYIMDGKKYVKK